MNEQRQQIQRVNHAIASYVTAYLKLKEGQEFHADSLRQYVFDHVNGYVAPGSADRILRDLRQKGVVRYEVVNRRQSLYKSLPVVYQPSLI